MKKIIAFSTVVFMILSLAACSGKSGEDTPAANQTTDVQTVDFLDAMGMVKANEIKDISLEFSAEVKKVLVKKGQKVREGEELIQLDTSDFLAKISNKEYELDVAKVELQNELFAMNNLNKAIKGKKDVFNNNKLDFKEIINEIQNAQKDYEAALGELAVNQPLYEIGAISKSDLGKYVKQADTKKQAVDALLHKQVSMKYNIQKEIEQLENELNQKEISVDGIDSISVLKNKITILEKELNGMKESLNKSYIKQGSIISNLPNGLVYEMDCYEGGVINPQLRVIRILNLDSLVVEADVPEEYIKDVKIGSVVNVKPLADESRIYKGKVVSVSSLAEVKNSETIIPIEISFEDEHGFLMPGFNVDVEIKTTEE